MKLVVATESSTLIRWWRASLLESPTVVPASTAPWRWIAPVRVRIASSRVVLPLWKGPTSAMHRGPAALVPFCAISASLVDRDAAFLEPSGPDAIVSNPRGDWQEAAVCAAPAAGTAVIRPGIAIPKFVRLLRH